MYKTLAQSLSTKKKIGDEPLEYIEKTLKNELTNPVAIILKKSEHLSQNHFDTLLTILKTIY